VIHSIINGECPEGMQSGSTCSSVGATCSIFLGAAGCGGQCVCEPDQQWQCEISCTPIYPRDASTYVDASYVVEASVAVDAFVATPDASTTVVDASVAPMDGGVCCGDGQNLDFPPSDSCTGNPLAWEYIPTCDFPVALIELYNAGGPVAILDSDGVAPGKTLWSGTFPSASTAIYWQSAEVFPPVALQAGHRYFLFEGQGPCSIASGGEEQPYYAVNPSGGWDGPYVGHAWTARLGAQCE
jgi:hypothetical protein